MICVQKKKLLKYKHQVMQKSDLWRGFLLLPELFLTSIYYLYNLKHTQKIRNIKKVHRKNNLDGICRNMNGNCLIDFFPFSFNFYTCIGFY